jgi:hypothetical protein
MTEGAQPGGPGSVVGFMQELVAIFTGESTRAASRLCLGNGYSKAKIRPLFHETVRARPLHVDLVGLIRR